MLENKRILVTGGAGVIGKSLVEKLTKMNAIILVGDLKSKPKEWGINIKYRKGDLNFITEEEIEFFDPEYVFHLAATFERSFETYDFWDENYKHNVNLSHHIINCLKKSKNLKKIIFASSYLIYDPEIYLSRDPKSKPKKINEKDNINPRNICGSAKLYHETEYKFLSQFKETEFDYICARIFRVFGKNSSDVISRWIRSLLKNETIEVYNKKNLFDYIYADDVAEGLIRLATTYCKGVFNIGTEKSTKIEEVVEILKKEFTNPKIKDSLNNSSYESSEADMSLFQNTTNWIPSTTVEKGIKKIIEFERLKKYDEDTLPINILITSISKKIPLINCVKNALLKIGSGGIIHGGDSDKNCLGKYFIDKFWNMPRFDELKDQEIIDYCKKNEITIIIPTRDSELLYFAKNKQKYFENNIQIMISDFKGVENVLDKLLFNNKCKIKNIPIIKTVEDIDELNCDSYVVKEQHGSGSQKIGINLSKNKTIDWAKNLKNPIFQPFIQGEEFTVDVYVNKMNKVKGVITRSRDMIVNGESQITTIVKKPKLEEICIDLAESFKLFGHVNIQAKEVAENEFAIIECNPRFGGASTLSVESGLDSFYWFLLEAKNEQIVDYPFLQNKKIKKQIRYPQNFFI